MASAESGWLTRSEVAGLLRFSEKTLANWASSVPRKGPLFTKVGGRARYRLVDVVAWQRAQFGESSTDAA